ncbi:MAG TPA: prephenate dehydratase domain-containing protein [Pyrinomonadaceae bacterium]|jgi:chorismate mutase/prephenate dehydratase
MKKVAIQGIEGSYSEEAAKKIVGAGAEILCCRDFEQTFDTVLAGRAFYSVVPLKNKILGSIEKPLELLNKSNLRVLDEMPLEIRHVLVGTPNADFENAQTIESHVEALKQCKKFLSENPQIRQIVGDDTASSVKRTVAEKDAARVAIGSRRAAEIYGGKILRENIADDAENVTWFYLLGRK